jgi:hypothetical protein
MAQREPVLVVLPESWFTFASPNPHNLLDAALVVLRERKPRQEGVGKDLESSIDSYSA